MGQDGAEQARQGFERVAPRPGGIRPVARHVFDRVGELANARNRAVEMEPVEIGADIRDGSMDDAHQGSGFIAEG
jgi:hypothetical protein